jgi:hypothetical protein
MTSDFELDLLGFAVALYACSCASNTLVNSLSFKGRERERRGDVHEASFLLQISMNCLMSETSLGMMGEGCGGWGGKELGLRRRGYFKDWLISEVWVKRGRRTLSGRRLSHVA